MEELSVSTSADFVNNSGLQINEDCTGNVLAVTCFAEESRERSVVCCIFLRNETIGLDTVFQTIKLPTSVTDLNTSLTDVNTDDFSHDILI
ncbi:hypothetical protein BD560DRAFT_403235 [Blakeslea trispora]|nr:hypothetical protein BD560DRAFT_403235 [Blakeslea trispora]